MTEIVVVCGSLVFFFSPAWIKAVDELKVLGATIFGFWLSNHMQSLNLIGKLKLVKQVGKLLREGILTAEVGAKFPLEQIAEAVTAAEQPARTGKVLLTIGK